jgi:transcriptional regulator with XRE-family HTH domain
MHITPSAIAAPVQNEFGLQMKRARKEARLTQKELADQIGVNPETITRVERGFNTRIETMVKIRQALPRLTLYTDRAEAVQATLTRELHLTQQARTDLTDAQTRVIHLVQAIDSVERLQKIQAFVLRALIKDLTMVQVEQPAAVPPIAGSYTKKTIVKGRKR